jgi:hypothetical protein
MREKEDKSVATITIPFFKAPQCLLDLTSEEKSYENLSHQVIGTSWQVIKKISKLQPLDSVIILAGWVKIGHR